MVRSREFISSSSSSSDSDSSSDEEFYENSTFSGNSLPLEERGFIYAKLLFVLALGKSSTYLYRILRVTLELFCLLPITSSRKILFYAELEFHFYQIYFLSRLPSKVGSQARAKRIFLDFFVSMIKEVCDELCCPIVREFTILYIIGFEERKEALGDVNITLDASKIGMPDSDVNFEEHRAEARAYAAQFLKPGFDLENSEKLINEKGFRFSKKTTMPSSLQLLSSVLRKRLREMSKSEQPEPNLESTAAIGAKSINTPIIQEMEVDDSSSSALPESTKTPEQAKQVKLISEPNKTSEPIKSLPGILKKSLKRTVKFRDRADVYEIDIFQPKKMEKTQLRRRSFSVSATPEPKRLCVSTKRNDKELCKQDLNQLAQHLAAFELSSPSSMALLKNTANKLYSKAVKLDGILRFASKLSNESTNLKKIHSQWQGITATYAKIFSGVFAFERTLDTLEKKLVSRSSTSIYLEVSNAVFKRGWMRFFHTNSTHILFSMKNIVEKLQSFFDLIETGGIYEIEFTDIPAARALSILPQLFKLLSEKLQCFKQTVDVYTVVHNVDEVLITIEQCCKL